MIKQLPKTQSMNISDVEAALPRVVRQVQRDQLRILIEESGTPVVALISAGDLARFDELEKEHDARFAVIECTRAAFDDVPAAEIEAETDRIIARLRAENHVLPDDQASTE